MPARGQKVYQTVPGCAGITKSEQTPLPPLTRGLDWRAKRAKTGGEKKQQGISDFVSPSVKTSLRSVLPPQALSRCPKFATLGARANFDRFAALASLFPPPAALRRRRPSEGGKVTSAFRFHHSRNVCPCRTVLGRARSPAPTAAGILFPAQPKRVSASGCVLRREQAPALRCVVLPFPARLAGVEARHYAF